MISAFFSKCNILLLLILVSSSDLALSNKINENDRVVLTLNNGIIESTNVTDITYIIKAPVGKKIELIVDHFNFLPFRLEDVKHINEKNNAACINNHHLIIANLQGGIDDQLYEAILKNSTEWIFCDSNQPFRKFLSLSNELKIANVLNGIQSTRHIANYKIRYRFLDTEFIQNGQIRVVQDSKQLSPINGYLLTIKVPANHHLRFFGKSIKCQMPTYTVISKNSTSNLYKGISKVLELDSAQFNFYNCSYMFDISEPEVLTKSDWFAEWYLKFESPFDQYDFELNWKFIANQIIDDKKKSTIDLPLQFGFDISEELEFEFLATQSRRKYSIEFLTVQNVTKESTDKSYIRSKIYGLQEMIIPLLSTSFSQSNHALKKFNGTLFIKRYNDWFISITYDLESNSGDCDFDDSFCEYSYQDHKNNEKSFKLIDNNEFLHLPKYRKFNPYLQASEEADFYIGVKKDIVNKTMYSPLIRVQDYRDVDKYEGSINSKLITLSFSYMYENNDDFLGLIMKSERSDVKSTLMELTSSRKTIYSTKASEFPKSKKIERSIFERCESNPLRIWKRVDSIPIFSCVDFRLEFVFSHGKSNTSNLMGLDDIEINYGNNDLTKCDEMQKCSNNGECYNFNNQETCCCFPGFIGDDCGIKVDPCNFISCQNNGTCVKSEGFDYECLCKKGFTGAYCETEINECLENPCGNNGKCFDKIGSYECACEPGYSGVNCQDVSEYCKKTCSDEGTLRCFENGPTNVKCKCKPGFTGEICDININECLSNPCYGESECIDKIDEFECQCPEDRIGKYCQIKINFCEEHGHLCQENSVCLDTDKNATYIKCACAYGFTGTYCNETIIQPSCEANSCNGGVCIEQEIGYKCECPKGMIGNNCEIKPDNVCFGNKCQNGHCLAFNTPLGDDYICKCYDNYAGEFCQFEECRQENMDQFCVKNNTVGMVKDKSFQDKLVCHCLCKNGYIGERCEEKINLCTAIDEAVSFWESQQTISYGNHCRNNGECYINESTNEVQCKCPAGYIGERCEEKVTNICSNNPCIYGACVSLGASDSYECICTSGWEGANCNVRKHCLIDDECVANNTNSVTFSYSDNRCICDCKHGFEGNDCSINHDDCVGLNPTHMCQNGGECIDKIGTYECRCPSGYGGFFCETKLKGCLMNPCKFGECQEDNIQTFKCKCEPGYEGDLCDQPVNMCEPNPCENDAKCHNLIPIGDSTSHDFFCECPPEFGKNSKTCSHRTIDPCIVSPCLNNATCISTSDFLNQSGKKVLVYSHFTCKCPKGFTGEYCEEKITSCSPNPCLNKGSCLPGRKENSFTCRCFPAFTGKFCEHLLDQCANFPCEHGATCMSTPHGYKCQCPINFTGRNCDIPLSPCENMKCLNGGKCLTDLMDVPYCECDDRRFIGTQCEISLMEFTNATEVKVSALLESKDDIQCAWLGNDVKTIDYIFFFLIVAFTFIIIVCIIYVYVHLNVKHIKRYLKRVSTDNEITTEINQVVKGMY